MKPSQSITICLLLHVLKQIEGHLDIATCGQFNTTNWAGSVDSTNWVTQLGHGFSSNHYWPWHAVIYHQYNNSDPDYKCEGTVISRKSVLTSAHCMHVNNAELNVEIVTVSLGRLTLTESESTAQSLGVGFYTCLSPRF